MSQTDKLTYSPLLIWFIILILLLYFVIYTMLLYNVSCIFRSRVDYFLDIILNINIIFILEYYLLSCLLILASKATIIYGNIIIFNLSKLHTEKKKFLNIDRRYYSIELYEFPYYIGLYNKTFFSSTEHISKKKKELNASTNVFINSAFIHLYYMLCVSINLESVMASFYSINYIKNSFMYNIKKEYYTSLSMALKSLLTIQYFKYLPMLKTEYRIFQINWIGSIMYFFLKTAERKIENWKKLEKKLTIMSSFKLTALYNELYYHYKIIDSVKLKKNNNNI